MSDKTNFLLGRGERLTKPVPLTKGGGPKVPPYDLARAKARLSPRVRAAVDMVRALPPTALPGDQAVALVTMHPRYITKSDFPEALLEVGGLRAIGSKSAVVRPEEWGVKRHPDQSVTSAVYVAGTREDFERLESALSALTDRDLAGQQLRTIEDFAVPTAGQKVKGGVQPGSPEPLVVEVVLHTASKRIFQDFVDHAEVVNATVYQDRARQAGGLLFVPVRVSPDRAEALSAFSFLRVLRGMPTLRPIARPTRGARLQAVLPDEPALDPELKVAIFDGGLPNGFSLPWVRYVEPSGIGLAVPEFEAHGLAVTSSFLFGPLEPGVMGDRPVAMVDHYRVLDDAVTDPLQMYDVLDRILEVLDDPDCEYDFVNLSLGPAYAVDDDDVDLWTSSLDERLAKRHRVVTVAAGNDGDLDPVSGLARVQPPADGVNVLSVGAYDVHGPDWNRADYSCIGPGRSPGLVKPDGLGFGGSAACVFHVLADATGRRLTTTDGTSFAAPSVLRAAAGVRATLGDEMSPLALRALMIHRTSRSGQHVHEDVGWGRFAPTINDHITCDDHEAIVVYQGSLPVGEMLRAWVPLPQAGLSGEITITATICIAPDVDGAHPASYTRNGLEVWFRPHSQLYSYSPSGVRSMYPITAGFFSPKQMYAHATDVVHKDAGKWEPCRHSTKTFSAAELYEPCFDVRHHQRDAGAVPDEQTGLPYALIITLQAPSMPDLYNDVVRTYQNVLQPLAPVRIRVRT